MKITRVLAISGLCLFTTIASAYTPSPFNRVYVGASAGGAWVVSDINSSSQHVFDASGTIGTIFTTTNNQTNVLKNTVFKGGVYTGYGYVQDSFYLGVEAFLSDENFRESNTIKTTDSILIGGGLGTLARNFSSNTSTSISPFQIGIDLRPGYLLTPHTLFYGRLGTSLSRISMTTNMAFNGGITVVPEAFSRMASASDGKNVATVRVGLGLEEFVRDNISVRTDFIYTYYGTLSTNNSLPMQVLPSGDFTVASQHTSAKVTDNAIMLSLSYFLDMPNKRV